MLIYCICCTVVPAEAPGVLQGGGGLGLHHLPLLYITLLIFTVNPFNRRYHLRRGFTNRTHTVQACVKRLRNIQRRAKRRRSRGFNPSIHLHILGCSARYSFALRHPSIFFFFFSPPGHRATLFFWCGRCIRNPAPGRMRYAYIVIAVRSER